MPSWATSVRATRPVSPPAGPQRTTSTPRDFSILAIHRPWPPGWMCNSSESPRRSRVTVRNNAGANTNTPAARARPSSMSRSYPLGGRSCVHPIGSGRFRVAIRLRTGGRGSFGPWKLRRGRLPGGASAAVGASPPTRPSARPAAHDRSPIARCRWTASTSRRSGSRGLRERVAPGRVRGGGGAADRHRGARGMVHRRGLGGRHRSHRSQRRCVGRRRLVTAPPVCLRPLVAG